VKRALDITLNTAKSAKKVYMLADIVHNEDVVKEIEKAGIKKIKKLKSGKNKILLLPAHGTPLETVNKALDYGYKIIDATCPMVKEIHKIAKRMEKKGYKIIIIGDKKHDEVYGVIGQIKGRAIVIDNINNVPLKKLKHIKKACVVAQSTQEPDNVLKIVEILKSQIKELKFFNTICKPTRMKQRELKTMSLENDAMIIIGSKTSANTKRLYGISKSLNKRSYWVSSKEEIRPQWFKDIKRVGITAGASTPEALIQGVVKYILQIS
jgi:4-hydroxy-3-methylbut-2-enyl diphosphate reductase